MAYRELHFVTRLNLGFNYVWVSQSIIGILSEEGLTLSDTLGLAAEDIVEGGKKGVRREGVR